MNLSKHRELNGSHFDNVDLPSKNIIWYMRNKWLKIFHVKKGNRTEFK